MRLRLALLTGFFSLSLACGGVVRLEPGDDGGGGDTDPTDTGVTDTGVLPDTGGGCGFGACTPGASCYDGCNNCYCSDDGTWGCTARWCEDTGVGPDTDVPDTFYPDVPAPYCPSYEPTPGTGCAGPIKCAYTNSCGATDVAVCPYSGGTWSVSYGSCPEPYCPSVEPKDGSYCNAPAKCGYTNSCGGYDTAWCDTTKKRWVTEVGPCPPPPPPPATCPTTAPKPGSPCTSSWISCGWNNGCGGVLNGYCDGASWYISDSGCMPGCPSSKPTSGAACKPPSSSSCTYVTPSMPSGYCESNCFCAEDYRWACIPGSCTSSGGGGGWVDAGAKPF